MLKSGIDGLGPLPKRDRQAELQELSFRALKAALPVECFLLRDERTDDAGVDASLELLINGQSTNFRAQVQLKATDAGKAGLNGAVPVPLATRNLNYLLNGPSSLYILYVHSRNELRFLWACDEARRLEKEKADWKCQGTVTLHFRNLLDVASLDVIYTRVFQESQWHRGTLEKLRRASAGEMVRIGFDPATLASTDATTAQRQILVGGMALVSSGFAAEVIRLATLVSMPDIRFPRLQLVLAYASFTLGRRQAALAHVAEALVRASELSAFDRQFLDVLKDAVEFEDGRISLEDYARRHREHAGTGVPEFALGQHLHIVQHALWEEQEPSRRDEHLSEIRSVVASIDALPEVSPAFRANVQLTLLHWESVQTLARFAGHIGLLNTRRALGRPLDLPAMLRDLVRELGEWEEKLDEIGRDAAARSNLLLTSKAITTRVAARVGFLSFLVFLHDKATDILFPEAVYRETMAAADQARRFYAWADDLEGELRATLFLADLFEIGGQEEAARALAIGVLPKAQAMNYASFAARAQQHLAGQTPLQHQRETAGSNAAKDEDVLFVEQDDASLRKFARTFLQAEELPPDRLPALERAVFWDQASARERLYWCRHLQLMEDLTHTWDRATYYRSDPDRQCVCARHGYRSAAGLPDATIVISMFKQEYCRKCPDRNPKTPIPKQNEHDADCLISMT